METRVDKVAEKHKSGYNCAQAVACAYCDLVGIDEETMFRMTEGLGLGMGGMEGTCGAVTAACVIAGAKNSTVEMGGPGTPVKACPDCVKDAARILEEVVFGE